MASPLEAASSQKIPTWVDTAEASLRSALLSIGPFFDPQVKVTSRQALYDGAMSPTGWGSQDPDLFVSIKSPLFGDVEGDLAWLIPWDLAKGIWLQCLGRSPEVLSELSEVEIATMLDLGSQFASSFAESLSVDTGTNVQSGSVRIAIEMLSAIFETVYAEAASKAPYVGCAFRLSDHESRQTEALVFFRDHGSRPFSSQNNQEAA